MQPTKKPGIAISTLEAEINRYTKLLDQSFTDKAPLEKIKPIFHDLKILTEKLAEMKTVKRRKKVRFVPSYLRTKFSRA